MKCKLLLLFLPCLAVSFGGCSSTAYSGGYSKPSDTVYVRDNSGQTQFKIQESNVFKPDGTRVARIDSSGNIYNTTGTRIGKIGKK